MERPLSRAIPAAQSLAPALIDEAVTLWAAERPHAIAVISGDEQLTYAELDLRGARLACELKRHGVVRNKPVGVYLPRGTQFIVGLLGILKAGAAYLPLEPGQPAGYLARQLALAGADIVVSGRAPTPFGEDVATLNLEDLPNLAPDASTTVGRPGGQWDDLAYVLYTSGSTGQPKAVAVPHKAVVRLVTGQDFLEMSPRSTHLFHSSPTFDASTIEIWGALLNGGRLVVAPPGPLSISGLAEIIRQWGVTMLCMTAAHFHLTVDEDISALAPLEQLIIGGDVISPNHLERARTLLSTRRLVAGYGPTEATVFATTYTVDPNRPIEGSVPIGGPIHGAEAYILEAGLHQVSGDAPGELHLGGDGLAWGYLGAAGLTADRFIPDPLSGRLGARLYRTGDRVFRREDKNIEFIGRVDHQLKVRGHRIEPAQVELGLVAHPDVAAAYVRAERNFIRGKFLVAYVSCRKCSSLDEQGLRHHMAQILPDYLRPDVYVLREVLPLTAHGKLDRRRILDDRNEMPGLTVADEADRDTSGDGGSVPDTDDMDYHVVLNDEEQYSIWPVGREIPAGWHQDGFTGSRVECLAHIEEVWTDMRPRSLRLRMDAR
jgi:amino acid adenylation domain-containing protein